MPQLHVYLFDNMQIIKEGGEDLYLPPSTQALFAYLALFSDRSHNREMLMDVFWKTQPKKNARRCLSSALWRLKKELTDGESCLKVSSAGNVKFEQSGVYLVDTLAFENLAHSGLRAPLGEMTAIEARMLEDAILLYRGDLLVGYYDEWVLQERERLSLLHLRCLSRLMRYYRHQGNLPQGILYGRRLLSVDPLREQIHRELMLLYMENDQRGLAIQQYELCRQALMNDLGIEPMAETQALYRQLSQQSHSASRLYMKRQREPAAYILEEIQHVMLALEQTQNRLKQLQELALSLQVSGEL